MERNDLKQENVYSLKHAFTSKTDTCNHLNCFTPHGKCEDKYTCMCKKGYVHAPYLTGDKFVFCNYAQKKHIVALILEFIFPFGFGHFYSSRNMIGMVKLILAIVVYFIGKWLSESYLQMSRERRETKKSIGQYIGYFILGSFFVAHLYDLVNFVTNKYPDGNGVPLDKF
jgi:hypothetical protein